MRLKASTQKQQEESIHQNLSFEEWLDHFSKEPTSQELDEMEKETYKKPQNNPYYQPLQGA